MTRADDCLQAEAAAELERLAACSQEPIRAPGAVQPYGALLAADPTSWIIVQVSENTFEVLGRQPDELLGSHLSVLVDVGTCGRLAAALAGPPGGAGDAVEVRIGSRKFETVVHLSSDGLAIMEFEPAEETTGDRSLAALHASTQRLLVTTTIDSLRTATVREIRALTGFDRVMMYRFHPDGHGEIVAENVADGLEAYLGLHFPASDVPLQARQLYVVHGSRAIATNEYRPAALLPRDNPRTGAPTDLSLADLRSVSQHHLQYMQNMGVAASMSLSMVHGGELIGMISCNHSSPRRVPYSLRRGCETVARQVTLQLRALEGMRELTHRLQLRPVRTRLAEQVADRDDDGGAALVAGYVTLLDLLDADGALVRLDGRIASAGVTPPGTEISALLERLDAGGVAVRSDALAIDRPDLAAVAPSVVGVVASPIGAGGDYVLWFRRAISQTVDWLGEQSSDNRATTLSPRNSFSSWRQTVTDRARPWSDVELREVDDLTRDLARLTAQAGVRRASASSALAASVASGLAETLDAKEAASRLARLVVPALAEWAVVTLVKDSDQARSRPDIHDVASWHVNPALRPAAERYAERRLESLNPDSFLRRALVTGELITRSDGAMEAIESILRPGQALDLLHELAPAAFSVVPLRGRTSVLGLLTLFNGAARGATTANELATALDIAARAGLALDNARLYRGQRLLAEGFQRSLLTEPQQSDHLEIVVRYVPAAEAAKVGGDWYDAFAQPDGATMLVIGDVVGHDTTAAAAMGQLRSLLRGIAVATGVGPAELLRQVDAAMATLGDPTIATAVVARLEQSVDERRRGAAHVTWSNAGHPDPMVISADGVVSRLAHDRPDMLLGVRADARRTESTVTLEQGTTLLFYTDGLVEHRARPVRDGMASLQDLLGQLHGLHLSALTDEILARMLLSQPEDDVALLAVRLRHRPTDRERESSR
ncbi:MAG: SpoIIE family protein phosphatase [Cellulomonas sp.]